jgi:hypothetical protein
MISSVAEIEAAFFPSAAPSRQEDGDGTGLADTFIGTLERELGKARHPKAPKTAARKRLKSTRKSPA